LIIYLKNIHNATDTIKIITPTQALISLDNKPIPKKINPPTVNIAGTVLTSKFIFALILSPKLIL
jgi:hypothetical protein